MLELFSLANFLLMTGLKSLGRVYETTTLHFATSFKHSRKTTQKCCILLVQDGPRFRFKSSFVLVGLVRICKTITVGLSFEFFLTECGLIFRTTRRSHSFFRGKVVSGFVERVLVVADVSFSHSFRKPFRKFSELGSTSKEAFVC